jgi:hypothetical protein
MTFFTLYVLTRVTTLVRFSFITQTFLTSKISLTLNLLHIQITGTMKACLDPEVAVISPSLETRFLTGVALSAAVGYFLTTGDFTEISPEIAEGLDDSIPAVDSLFGGVASMLQGLKVVEEEGAEALIEEESLFAVFSPELVAASVRQFFIAVLKALGLLGL